MARGKSRAGGCLVTLLLLVALVVAVGYATGAIAHFLYVMSGAQDRGVEAVEQGFESRIEAEFEDRYYAYSQLDEEGQRCYRIMYDAFCSREPLAYPENGDERLSEIRACIIADHPELFYVEGVRFSTMYNQVTELVSSASIEGTFFLDEDETASVQSQIDAVVASFLETVPPDADDYTKAKLAYDYIVKCASYDREGAASLDWFNGEGRAPGQTIDDVFLRGSAVCAGYSSAYQYLLQCMGIQCVQVRGVADGVGHAWCVALLDGAYYQIDPTWGDPQFLGEESIVGDDYVNYDFLAVTTEDMALTHAADETFEVPLCVSTDDNYFVREGLLFDWADTWWFGQLVSDAEASGEQAVQIRCANDEAYHGLLDGFVMTGDLGHHLSGDGYRYTYNDDMRTITVFPQAA